MAPGRLLLFSVLVFLPFLSWGSSRAVIHVNGKPMLELSLHREVLPGETVRYGVQIRGLVSQEQTEPVSPLDSTLNALTLFLPASPSPSPLMESITTLAGSLSQSGGLVLRPEDASGEVTGIYLNLSRLQTVLLEHINASSVSSPDAFGMVNTLEPNSPDGPDLFKGWDDLSSMFTSTMRLNCFLWYPGSPLKLLLSADVVQLINSVYQGEEIEPNTDITPGNLQYNSVDYFHAVTASATTLTSTCGPEEIGFNLTTAEDEATAEATASYTFRASLIENTLDHDLLEEAMADCVNDQPAGENRSESLTPASRSSLEEGYEFIDFSPPDMNCK